MVAELIPDLANRLNIEESASRTIRFTSQEVQRIVAVCKIAIPKATDRKLQDRLQSVVDAATLTLEQFQEGSVARIPVAERLYQFKITLWGIKPPIWRRIQVKHCTLDKLHEHIQTAMDGTNSHLHSFRIREQYYGDPMLLQENFDEMDYEDSTTTRLSRIVSKSDESFRFDYEYDFGDRWKHSVLFEGCVRASKGTRYPTCLEGERACPPEDVGGVLGYQEYLTTLSNPEHKVLRVAFHVRKFLFIGTGIESPVLPQKTIQVLPSHLWWIAGNAPGLCSTDVLESVHSDLAVQKSLDLLAREQNRHIQERLAHAALSHFSEERSLTGQRVGRDDPCPCGSGKKYRQQVNDELPEDDGNEWS